MNPCGGDCHTFSRCLCDSGRRRVPGQRRIIAIEGLYISAVRLVDRDIRVIDRESQKHLLVTSPDPAQPTLLIDQGQIAEVELETNFPGVVEEEGVGPHLPRGQNKIALTTAKHQALGSMLVGMNGAVQVFRMPG